MDPYAIFPFNFPFPGFSAQRFSRLRFFFFVFLAWKFGLGPPISVGIVLPFYCVFLSIFLQSGFILRFPNVGSFRSSVVAIPFFGGYGSSHSSSFSLTSPSFTFIFGFYSRFRVLGCLQLFFRKFSLSEQFRPMAFISCPMANSPSSQSSPPFPLFLFGS